MAERQRLTITRLGAQGDGIADSPGGAVFAPGALPGEVIDCAISGDRARSIVIAAPSADRVTPPCRHFGTCGGCVAQHMADDLYRSWKRDLVASAFRHRGLDVEISELLTVGPGRRRRATFTAKKKNGRLTFGFHEEGSHTLVDIEVCPVVTPAIEGALSALRTIAAAAIGEDESVRIAVTEASEGLDVALTDGPLDLDAASKARIAEAAHSAAIVRVTSSGDILMQSAAPTLSFGSARVALPPASFLQATPTAETAIAAVLADATRKSKRTADLFCGLGTFTFALARNARVLAMDTERAAIEALKQAAKAAQGVKQIEARVRDLMREPLSRTELAEFDAVVLDPPRAGARDQVEAIGRSKVPLVAMVSCNPATMARDCRTLVDAGFKIERLIAVDQFTWSPHVEAVAVLRRATPRK